MPFATMPCAALIVAIAALPCRLGLCGSVTGIDWMYTTPTDDDPPGSAR